MSDLACLFTEGKTVLTKLEERVDEIKLEAELNHDAISKNQIAIAQLTFLKHEFSEESFLDQGRINLLFRAMPP